MAITTVTLENLSTSAQANVPFTFAQHFAKGDLKAGTPLELSFPDMSAVPCQVDVKATHADGSVKHAVLSAIIPQMAASASVAYDLTKALSAPTGTPPAPTDFPGLNVVATIIDNGTDVTGPNAGTVYTTNASAKLAAGQYEQYLQGPIVSEWIVRAPLITSAGVEHPDLHARFAIRAYKGQQRAKIDCIVENDWAKPKAVMPTAPGSSPWETVSNTPKIYAYSIKIGNAVADTRALNGFLRIPLTYNGSGTYDAFATGIPNDATVYTAAATIDGVRKPLSLTGSAIQTYGQLRAAINTQLGTSGTCEADVDSLGLRIKSATTGKGSTVSLDYGTLFPALLGTGLSAETAVGKVVTYTASVAVNGVSKNVSVDGYTALSFAKLCALLNAQLAGFVTCEPQMAAPGIRFTPLAAGATVIVTDGTLFAITKTKATVPLRPIRGDEFIHYPFTRWKKTFWWGSAPATHVRHDKKYLIASRAVPNYPLELTGSATKIATNLATMKANEDIGQNGMTKAYMGAPGYAPGIGVLPEWQAMYLVNQGPDAKYVMLKQADLLGSWMVHARDYVTDRPISFANWPFATWSPSASDSRNAATGLNERLPLYSVPSHIPANANKADVAHHPDFCFVPYLVTGDHYYMEGLLFQFNFTGLNLNAHPIYRDGRRCLWMAEGQTRGKAWSFRTAAHARYLIPDTHPNRVDIEYASQQNAEWFNANYADPADSKYNMFGHFWELIYSRNGGTKNANAPWQNDFVTSAVGRSVELGYEEFLPLLAYASKQVKGRLTSGPDFCWYLASNYNIQYRDTETAPLYTSWAEVYDKTFAATITSKACGSPEFAAAVGEKVGNMVGYPTDVGGFPANMQPAVAYCATFDMPSGDDAWLVFDSRAEKPDYNLAPQFSIVPRMASVATPPQEPQDPDPNPDPIPDPQPTDTINMAIADNVQDSTTSTGPGDIILAGLPKSTFQTWHPAIPLNERAPYAIRHRTLNEREAGFGHLASEFVFVRDQVTSSTNNNEPVNFSEGVKDISCDLTAAFVEELAGKHNVTVNALSVTPSETLLLVEVDGVLQKISLPDAGQTFAQMPVLSGAVVGTDEFQMARAGVDSRATFSAVAAAVKAYIDSLGPTDNAAPQFLSAQVSNATPNIILLTFNETLGPYTPAAAAFSVSGGKTVTAVSRNGASFSLTVSAPYVYGDTISVTYTKPTTNPIQDATGNQTASFGPSGVVNNIAAPGDTVVPTASTAAVANASPTTVTITASEPLDELFIPAASAFTVSGHTVSAVGVTGSTIKLTVSAAFVNGEAARTAAYTKPGTNGVRDLTGNQMESFSGLTITNSVAAVATAPGAPTIGTITAGDGSVTVPFTAPASNGGAAITAYPVSVYKASDNTLVASVTGAASPITVTGVPGGTPVYAKVAAANSVGTGPQSAASNSVTLASTAKTYTITPYTAGNTFKTSLSRANAGGTYPTAGSYFVPNSSMTTPGTYWNFSPNVPAGTNVRFGWSLSNTVPPANEITTSQNVAGDSSVNGYVAMVDRADPAWEQVTYLWALPGNEGPYYPWIRVGNEDYCLLPSGLTVTA